MNKDSKMLAEAYGNIVSGNKKVFLVWKHSEFDPSQLKCVCANQQVAEKEIEKFVSLDMKKYSTGTGNISPEQRKKNLEERYYFEDVDVLS